jgi:hypothetical protein
MLEEILKLNGEAAASGEYEVAYHLLMAALHVVDHGRDPKALERIAALAREQGEALERVQPPHQLSRSQAQQRGQTALYDSLAAHIEAVRLRLRSDRQRAKRHR